MPDPRASGGDAHPDAAAPDGVSPDAAAPDGTSLDVASPDGAPLDVLSADGGSADGAPNDMGPTGPLDSRQEGPDDGAQEAPAPHVVRLQNATATFSQTNPGTFLITAAIDGSTTNGLGWAIHPKEGEQTAAFQTTADTPTYPTGTLVTFALQHNYAVEHALGRFRLAYTTSARAEFADGNDGGSTPGKIGPSSLWHVLAVRTAVASTGATLSAQPDGSILAQDLDSPAVTYTITGEAPVGGITGFRLEVLPDARLPFKGPGLQNTNGNFVLSELSVTVAPL